MKITVEKDDTLLKYLLNSLNDLSHKRVKSLLTNEMINIRGKIITQYNYHLKKGDVIEIKNNILNKRDKYNIHILYEDNDLIIVNKPAGLLTIATDKKEKNTLYNKVREYIKRDNYKNKIFIVHRLDRETSGIILFAKNAHIKNILQEKWNTIVQTRHYIAIVSGCMDKKEGVIHTWLTENRNKQVYSTKDKKEGREAITEYKVIEENNQKSLVSLYIKTGRKNQIRVHLKENGYPIVGDTKYGGLKAERMYLHNDKLVFKHPVSGKEISLKIELPTCFTKIMK